VRGVRTEYGAMIAWSRTGIRERRRDPRRRREVGAPAGHDPVARAACRDPKREVEIAVRFAEQGLHAWM